MHVQFCDYLDQIISSPCCMGYLVSHSKAFSLYHLQLWARSCFVSHLLATTSYWQKRAWRLVIDRRGHELIQNPKGLYLYCDSPIGAGPYSTFFCHSHFQVIKLMWQHSLLCSLDLLQSLTLTAGLTQRLYFCGFSSEWAEQHSPM